MIDLTPLASVAGLAVFLGIVIQFAKPYLPQTPAAPPLAAVAIGVVLSPLIGLTLGLIVAPAGALAWILGGFLAGVTATGGYEHVNNLVGPPSRSISSPTPPPAH